MYFHLRAVPVPEPYLALDEKSSPELIGGWQVAAASQIATILVLSNVKELPIALA